MHHGVWRRIAGIANTKHWHSQDHVSPGNGEHMQHWVQPQHGAEGRGNNAISGPREIKADKVQGEETLKTVKT